MTGTLADTARAGRPAEGPRERRRAHRYPAQLVVLYQAAGKEETLGHTRDLATEGLFVVTQRPPAVGTRLSLDLFLDASEEPAVRAEAVVRWRRLWRRPRGMGVELQCVSDAGRRRLRRWLDRLDARGVGAPEPVRPATDGGERLPADFLRKKAS